MTRNERFGVFVLIDALLIVAWACSSSLSGPTANGSFNVSGRVLDFQSNAGVSGATVVFADPSNTTVIVPKGQSTADGSGSYQMSVSTGQYSVYVNDAYAGQALVRSGINHADVLVHANGCIARYGTIADSRTSRLLSGATVSLVGVTTTSDSSGAYKLDLGCRTGLWFGSICISVARTGYQVRCVPMGRGEGLEGVIRQDVDLDAS